MIGIRIHVGVSSMQHYVIKFMYVISGAYNSAKTKRLE